MAFSAICSTPQTLLSCQTGDWGRYSVVSKTGCPPPPPPPVLTLTLGLAHWGILDGQDVDVQLLSTPNVYSKSLMTLP